MAKKKHWNKLNEYTAIHGNQGSYDSNNTESIKKIWNERAISGKEKLPDKLQHELETNSLIKHISPSDKVLDVGCGSGCSSFIISNHCSEIIGVDYAKELIKKAKNKRKISNLKFQEGDITNLNFEDKTFDKVMTQRVLINLATIENQLIAIKEIHRVLKDDGIFLMLETNKQGLKNLNKVRETFKLDPIIPPWHNLPIDESMFFDQTSDLFECISQINFGNYFFLTRIIHPILVYPEKPSYTNKINRVAFEISDKEIDFAKDYSQVKIFVLRKISSNI